MLDGWLNEGIRILDLLLERTILDTSTSFSRWKFDITTRDSAVVLEISTVTTHACVRSIENGGLAQVVLITEPIPVRLVTLVAALFPQRRLVTIQKVSVPAQEIAGSVYRHRLVDVLGNEVVVS